MNILLCAKFQVHKRERFVRGQGRFRRGEGGGGGGGGGGGEEEEEENVLRSKKPNKNKRCSGLLARTPKKDLTYTW